MPKSVRQCITSRCNTAGSPRSHPPSDPRLLVLTTYYLLLAGKAALSILYSFSLETSGRQEAQAAEAMRVEAAGRSELLRLRLEVHMLRAALADTEAQGVANGTPPSTPTPPPPLPPLPPPAPPTPRTTRVRADHGAYDQYT